MAAVGSTEGMVRRQFLRRAGAGAFALPFASLLGAAETPPPFKFSMANETFEDWSFGDTCKAIRKAGYTGVEIAPFTIGEDPTLIPAGKRSECASIMRSEGLKFAAIHHLLMAPKGLQLTTPDKATRERSWLHMSRMIDLCADFGAGGLMVLGNPSRRGPVDGMSREDATKNLVAGLAGMVQHLTERGVTLVIEPFSTKIGDVADSLAASVAIARQVDSPVVRTMFDTRGGSNEKEAHAVLVDRYFEFIRHIHINEKGGPYPGTGNYDFKPVLSVLRRRGYAGWLSLELSNVDDPVAKSAGPVKIANDSLRYLEVQIAKLGTA